MRTSTRFNRERAAVPSARAFTQHVLSSAGTPDDVVERMVLAVAEACNNAILHAAGDDFTVSILVDGGRALISISDDGAGFDPPARPSMPGPQATGRRGLALMQALVDVVRVHRGELPRHREASDVLKTRAEAMAGERPWVDGRWMPPRHVFVTVVCRSGRVVPGPDELFWLLAWRYSNHLAAAYNGDVYLVTGHGWTGCADKRAGFTPALHSRPRHLAVQRPGAPEP